jgi:predicted nuclease of predicted toxin-antitoxin system
MAAVSFYFDEMMARPAAEQIVKRGYSVVMAVDVGMTQKLDDQHLKYATEQKRIMVTFDHPFAGKTMSNADHAGLICITGAQQDNFGAIIRLLVAFAEAHSAEDAEGKVFWLR